MTERTIRDIYAYVSARSEVELELVREVRERARTEDDYYREKVAAKLLAFHEKEVEFLRHYVSMKAHYPELARHLEEKKPYLRILWADAEKEWAELLVKKGLGGTG